MTARVRAANQKLRDQMKRMKAESAKVRPAVGEPGRCEKAVNQGVPLGRRIIRQEPADLGRSGQAASQIQADPAKEFFVGGQARSRDVV